MNCSQVLITIYVSISFVNSLRILAIIPIYARSHHITFSRLLRSLSEKGHNVSVITHYSEDTDTNLYRIVKIGSLPETMSGIPVNVLGANRIDMFTNANFAAVFGHNSCEAVFQSKAVHQFLVENHNFDLILLEDFFTECFWPLLQTFRCPVIRFVCHPLSPWNGKYLGNPLGSAYVPNMHLNFKANMSFSERLINFIANIYDLISFELSVIPTQEKIARKYFPVNENVFRKMRLNVSVVFVNSHYVLNIPKPLVPNIIEVGGVHIGNSKKLPEVSKFSRFIIFSFLS